MSSTADRALVKKEVYSELLRLLRAHGYDDNVPLTGEKLVRLLEQLRDNAHTDFMLAEGA